jgi:mannose-6-phosphate isomerase-like protein (cupin superfamily)
MNVFKLDSTGLFAEDATVRLAAHSLAPGASTPIERYGASDVAMLFFAGQGEALVADRAHAFKATQFAHARAGSAFQLRNTGASPLRYLAAVCPPAMPGRPATLDPKGGPSGVTMLKVDQYDRIPDSGLVRGGMFFLEAGGIIPQISQDESTKIFVVLQGECDLTVAAETRLVTPGDVIVIPREVTHSLRNRGSVKLAMWVTVTPNTSPSHTRYEQGPDGAWKRITPRG